MSLPVYVSCSSPLVTHLPLELPISRIASMLFSLQEGYHHAPTDASEVAATVIEAATSAKEVEAVVVVLSQVRNVIEGYLLCDVGR